MTTIIVTFVILYLVAGLCLGVFAMKRSQDSGEDYFVAKRSVSWIPLGLTLFATWMSTFAFIGSPGFYYKIGVRWFLPHGFLVVGSPLLLWFIGRHIWRQGREHGYITPADLLADFYKSHTVRLIVACICILALIPYCLIQLVGIGKVLEVATHGALPYVYGVVLSAVGIAVYTYLGGVRAIIWTDALQAVVFGLLMLVGATVAVKAAGGLAGGFKSATLVRPEAFTFAPGKVGSPLTLLVIWSFGYVLLPHMWQRAYMAKSEESLSRSIVLGSVLALALICIPSLLMGTLGIGFMSDLPDTDQFVPTLYRTFLPAALPLLVVATFAAGMSTVDSQLLSAASVVVRDIAQPLAKQRFTPHIERKLGRVFMLTFVSLLVALAVSPDSQGSIILLASKGTGIALLLLVPLCGPLFWTRATRAGGIASLLVGPAALLILEANLIKMHLPFGVGAPVAALVLQAVFFVGCSLVFRKDPSS